MEEAKRRGRSAMKASSVTKCENLVQGLTIEDQTYSALPKGIGIVYDDRMFDHECIWVKTFPEKPDRLKASIDRCRQYGLLERCTPVSSRMATEAEILRCHSQELFDLVRSSSKMSQDELKKLSLRFDVVYFNEATYEAAMLAAGSTVELVDQIVNNKIRHGMALVRPPGHHAMYNESNGYCVFNNAAIAARHAVDVLGVERVLMVDWDLHHGQGIQNAFYDDPRFLYFSIHRYEYGNFWPNLRESDYDHIGQGNGRGFNINIPFNKVGMTNGDYMAIFQQILMPVAYEFDPQLVIVSCGYDAAIGDPEGRSELTPAAYAHFTHMMKQLAGGKLAVVFEGGYCLKSLAESVALTLHSLLDDLCPQLGPLPPPMDSTVQSILHVIRVHRPYWKCFQYQPNVQDSSQLPHFFQHIEIPKPGVVFSTKDNQREVYDLEEFERLDEAEEQLLDKKIDQLIQNTSLFIPASRTCIAYDENMCQHQPVNRPGHVEDPSRITRIMSFLTDAGLSHRCTMIQSREATTDEIALVHSRDYIDQVERWSSLSDNELAEIESQFESIYLSKGTCAAARLAVGTTLNLVDAILTGKSLNGMAVVRPPGHHAEISVAKGFCIYNNVAIAARYAQAKYKVNKILILDWDVHHGNGIQNCFEKDASVLYISLHRGDIYPSTDIKKASRVGIGAGEGFNINIPWQTGSMGDAEYVAAFQQIVMPVAYEFDPDLVFVSAGFDAALGDPLGFCKITPTGYAHMTHMLSTLAAGKLILVLEGGYNLNSISESAGACVSVLLGDRVPALKASSIPRKVAVQTICHVLKIHRRYWKSLAFQVPMPTRKETLEWLGDPIPSTNGKVNEILYNEGTLERPVVDAIGQNVSSSASSMSESESDTEAIAGAVGGNATRHVTLHDAIQQVASGQDSLELYAVEPLPYCPHLVTVAPVPQQGLDTRAECLECKMTGENWVCLTCYQAFCSRYVNGHMEQHGSSSDHPMALSYADLSVWCYRCDAYVHNAVLLPSKRTAHLDKFGSVPPE